jgi:hypothetical protein
MNIPANLDGERFHRAIRLLEEVGLCNPGPWVPLAGGANNRVFRIGPPPKAVLLKAYFVHPSDSRDRLRADFGFSAFAWNHGVQAIARPVAQDSAGQIALFEYLPGRKLVPAEITWPRVREALKFFLAINHHREAPDARALPVASEACFSLAHHLECVERRVARLKSIEPNLAENCEAISFVRDELSARSDAVLERAREQAAVLGRTLEEPVPDMDRCLSPSDFGFHNALWASESGVKFIDFEYAGWDDPGKMVADFFCQPACPVPSEFFEEFASAVAARTSNPDRSLCRFRLLLPVYRLKWCCILLNDFLPAGGNRRRFAASGTEEKERKAQQLRKARAALQDLWAGHCGRRKCVVAAG